MLRRQLDNTLHTDNNQNTAPTQQRSLYRDVFIFVVTLLSANLLWKLSVNGIENCLGSTITFWGIDVTATFEWFVRRIAKEAFWVITLFRDTCVWVADDRFGFPTSFITQVAYSCTPIKQCFIWFCLVLTTRGGGWHKVWYIPVGWVISYGFNVLRIVAIAMLTEFHPTLFGFYHHFFFKFLFYGVLFLLWLFFIDHICPLSAPKKNTDKP